MMRTIHQQNEEFTALVTILHDELKITQKTISRSPILFKTGKVAFGVPRSGHETHRVSTRYWKLQCSRFVYSRGRQISVLKSKRELTYISAYELTVTEIEDIIQSLRLLRTPFNGAAVLE